MEEYKKWLESQIKNANETAEKYVKEKEFGTAYMYLAKVTAFEKCLAEFEKSKKESEQGVSFSELEVGKRYGIVSKKNGKKGSFTVIARGYDNKGRYIWYTTVTSETLAFKSYENEYKTVEYFVEIKNDGR